MKLQHPRICVTAPHPPKMRAHRCRCPHRRGEAVASKHLNRRCLRSAEAAVSHPRWGSSTAPTPPPPRAQLCRRVPRHASTHASAHARMRQTHAGERRSICRQARARPLTHDAMRSMRARAMRRDRAQVHAHDAYCSMSHTLPAATDAPGIVVLAFARVAASCAASCMLIRAALA